ncbi:MAG: SctK family type III secretion system sorting platform protein [Geminicoccaceae bacterium]
MTAEPRGGEPKLQDGVPEPRSGVPERRGGVPEPQGAPRRPSSLGSYRARLRFERLPAAYCHPERIAKLLPDGLPAGFRDRLIGSARLRHRLSSLLARWFRLAPCCAGELETPEGRFAQLEGAPLENALSRVGAIWHARKIRKIILAEPLRHLIESLGRDNYRAALRFIDLAAEDDAADEGADDDAQALPDVENLLGRIERDGLIAMNAWCHHQPAALAGRLKLKLPPCPEVDDQPPASHRDRGVMIVDCVVMTLLTEPQTRADDHD